MAKILIMDDEPGLLNVTFNMLKSTGHSLFLAEDGKQAIEIAQKEKPDLAILDMRVPDYDGLEVLAELKKMDSTIQCVMLSGFGDVETAVGAIKKGAFDYISKPFKVDEVLSVINKALAAKQKSPQPTSTGSVAESAKTSPAATAINVPSSYIQPKKLPTAVFGGIGALVLVVLGVIFFATRGISRQEYKLTYSSPAAIAFDGKNLWISEWVERSVYKHKLDKKLSIENVVSSPNHTPIGFAWDGSHFWSCDNMTGIIKRHLPNQNLSEIQTFETSLSPSVVGFDGGVLWVGDTAGKIYRFRITPGGLETIGAFQSDAKQISGVFFYNNNVWLSDSGTGKIYKYDPKSFSIIATYILKPYSKKKERIAGLTYDGKYIWSCVDGAGKVYRHPTSDLIPDK